MPLEFNETQLEKKLNSKIRFFVVLISLIFLFILFRLGYLQILKGSKYSALSTNNRIRLTRIPGPRGIILSKNNEILVKNTPSFDLNIIPQDTPDIDKVLNDLSVLLTLDKKLLKNKVDNKRGRPPFEPITIKKELSWTEMSLVLSKKMDLGGVCVDVVPKRLYCLGTFASHVFGFLGKINKEELHKKYKDYSIGDLVGKYALEKWGEKNLRGKKGGLQTEVDVFGNRQKVLAEIKPVPGCNLVISIIPALQKTAEVLLKGKTGAVVAMSPSNGEILVLASSPGFDSNLFARGIDYKEWKALIENPFHPLLNRAIQSQQPPGSVFKIVTAVAALEEKIVDPNEKFFCPGHFKLGRRKFNCWKRGGHGWLQMKDAIIESCDTYFYNIALRVGIDNIIKYSKLLGFGEKTEVELEGEKSGLVPSPKWKKTKYGSAWQKGETLNMSIGQGFLLATPLQIAVFFCGIANKGLIPKPRIVLEVTCEDFQTSFPPSIRKAYHLSPETFFLIKEALTGVVNSQKGTGRLAKTDSFVVAGKTGTSQVASIKNIKGDIEDIPWKLKDHAWFACFAPVEKPEIVVSVLLEHGGSGGKEAAPIAGEIIKVFKKLKKDV